MSNLVGHSPLQSVSNVIPLYHGHVSDLVGPLSFLLSLLEQPLPLLHTSNPYVSVLPRNYISKMLI